jgi:hypothetical protein
VEYAGCPAKASEDDVDDEVMVTTCSFEDGKWRHKESDDRKTESTLQTVISCESTVARIKRTKRPMANDQPGGAERPGSITLRRFRVVSSESDWRWLLTMEKKFWCCELWHVKSSSVSIALSSLIHGKARARERALQITVYNMMKAHPLDFEGFRDPLTVIYIVDQTFGPRPFSILHSLSTL